MNGAPKNPTSFTEINVAAKVHDGNRLELSKVRRQSRHVFP
jgi:hypothetical protein